MKPLLTRSGGGIWLPPRGCIVSRRSRLMSVHPSPIAVGATRHHVRHAALLAGVSVAALLMVAPEAFARPLGGGQPIPAAAAALAAAQSAQQDAARTALAAGNSLKRATLAIQALQASQQIARDAARAASNGSSIPNGLGVDGLQRAAGAVPGSALWQGANLPTQFDDGNRVKVNIQQTKQRAILTWDTFNVGGRTDLTFQQEASNWIVLNRVLGTDNKPSQILGSVNAKGQVYVINQNGIIFGGTAQVNVGTLVASALPINDALLNANILYSNPDNKFTFSAFSETDGAKGPTGAFEAPMATEQSQSSKVVVEAGALISTPTTSDHNGGRVALIGPEVINRGTILTPDGQTILAAGQQVLLRSHNSNDPSLRGLDVYIGSINAPRLKVASPSLAAQDGGVVTGFAANYGLIAAERGNITIAGQSVNQLGVVQATTSASLNGRIDLQAVYNVVFDTSGNAFPGNTGLVTLGAASLSQIMPEYLNTEKVIGTKLALNSRVIMTGLAAHLGERAQILAPSGEVTIQAGTYDSLGRLQYTDGQIYLDTGAAIDVFGSIVKGNVSDNIIAVELLGAQLADAPLQRNGFLRGKTIHVDIRQTGVRADGSVWIGTPLADVSGYVGLIQRGVGELTTAGGSVTLNAGASVVMRSGSALNVSNGWIDYQGGVVQTTRLVGADGRMYDISRATPDRGYVGFAGQWTRAHERWGITETWTSPLAGRGTYQEGYLYGAAGGTVAMQTRGAALDGLFFGNVVSGPRQRTVRPVASTFSLDGVRPISAAEMPAPLSQDVIFQADFVHQPVAPFDPKGWSLLSSGPIYLTPDLFRESGFGDVSINSGNGDIKVLSEISGQPGGSLTLTGKNIDIAAHIKLPGGSLKFTTANLDPGVLFVPGQATVADVAGRGNLTIREDVAVSTAGLIVVQTHADSVALPLTLDGGSISLDALHLDLRQGSIIDVSGGAAFSPDSKLSKGNGGSLTLRGGVDPRLFNVAVGQLNLGAALKGYALGKGGSLAIEVFRRIQIGGAAAGVDTLLLSPDFFNVGGFSGFSLTGSLGVEVTSGTLIAPEVQSYLPVLADAGFTLVPTLLDPALRPAASLSLSAGKLELQHTDVVIAAGASIRLDPTLSGDGRVSIKAPFGSAEVYGSIVVPGGKVTIAGSPGSEFADRTSVVLGAGSLVSTAGATVLAPAVRGLRQGRVLNGGSITVSGNIDAHSTALLDVSGTSAILDVGSGHTSLAGSGDARQRIDSDAGAIVIEVGEQFSIAGIVLRAAAGGPAANGGALTVRSKELGGVAVSQAPSGSGVFAIDSFRHGGFDDLTLEGNISFRGPLVEIAVHRSLTIGTTGLITAEGEVRLDAPHVALGWTYETQPKGTNPDTGMPALLPTLIPGNTSGMGLAVPTFGAGSLNVSASVIDIGTLALGGIGSVNLDASRGDIRGYGTFAAAGDITLTAGQIHPTTAMMFTVAALDHGGTPGRVTINPGTVERSLPLSAGGTLNIFASEIHQNGVLRAPLGTINLGSTKPQVGKFGQAPDVLTQTYYTTKILTLGARSVTSVSAVDPLTGVALTLPYGTMVNGTAWIDPNGKDITASGVSAKAVTLAGKSVEIGAGATIDLRGGGDFFAYNWVKGLGGTRDTLATSTSFAILPGYEANQAPLASIAASDNGWSTASLSLGKRVWLPAGDGLAAGYYTLLPARYALLPGAFLVTPKELSAAKAGISVRQLDGSSIVTGYMGNALTQTRASLPTAFEVVPSAVVRERAQYDLYSANVALRKGALARDAAVPRLPIDAGQLVLLATRSLNIQGQALMSAPSGGLGGIVDISTTGNIVVNSAGEGGAADTLYIGAAGLNTFGAESLLIGGVRSSTNLGTTVTVETSNIEIDNGDADPLYGPEIILVAKDGVTLRDGAAIAQSGTLSTPAQTLRIDGNGALLRVSSDSSAEIIRSGVNPGASGSLTIAANVRISGASVILDSTGAITFDPSAGLAANTLTLGGGQISLLFDGAGSQPSTGLVLPSTVLDGLQSTISRLALLSYSSIDFYGTGAVGALNAAGRPTLDSLALHAPALRGFDAGSGGVTFNARNVVIDNSSNSAAPPTGTSGPLGGALVFNSETLTIGKNAVRVDGYAHLDLRATGGVLLDGTGGLTMAGDMTVTAPMITASTAAKHGLTAGGMLSVNAMASETVVSGGLGADVTLAGARIDMNGVVRLPSGRLTLHATGTELGSDVVVGGTLDVGGRARAIQDRVSYTSGGEITLKSDAGSVVVAETGRINVSAQPQAGNAGGLTVVATTGTFTVRGMLSGHAGDGGLGGVFGLDVGSLPALGGINATLDRGGFDESGIRVRSGDVLVDGSVRTRRYLVAADSGATTVASGTTIDASGETGGYIGLYGYNGVTLQNGSMLTVAAQKLNAAGKGGAIALEVGQAKDVGGVLTPGVGWLDVQAGALIDLSVAGGPGGTLHLRAPRISGLDAAANPIPIPVNSASGGSDLAIKPLAGTIRNAASVVAEGFQVFDLTSTGTLTATNQSNAHALAQQFAANTAAIRDKLLAGTPNAGLGSAFHLRPGIEFVSRGDLQWGSGSGATAAQVWDLAKLRYGPGVIAGVTGSGEPGILTMRAAGNLIFQGSLSDGFVPGATATTMTNTLLPAGSQSWSYRLVAGADLGGAEFRQVLPLENLGGDSGSSGSLLLGRPNGNGTAPTSNLTTEAAKLGYDQVIRTGTGDIDIAAGRDVQIRSLFSTIYTAGSRVIPGYTATATLNPGGSIGMRSDVPLLFPNGTGTGTVTANVDSLVTYLSPSGTNVTLTNPEGTIYGFSEGYSTDAPVGVNGINYTQNYVRLSGLKAQIDTRFVGAAVSVPSGGEITGFAPGSRLYIGHSGNNSGNAAGRDIVAGGLTTSGPGIAYIPSGVGTYDAVPFNAGDALPLLQGDVKGRGAYIVLTEGGSIRTTGTLILPAGSFTLQAPNASAYFQLRYLPAETTLRLADSAGGGISYRVPTGTSGAVLRMPAPSFLVTEPLHAGQSVTLRAGSSVTASANCTGSANCTLSLSPSSAAATVTLPSADASGNTYVFDVPKLGSDGQRLQGGGNDTTSQTQLYALLFTTPQYSSGGGDVTIAAGRDIIHQQAALGYGQLTSSQQMPVNWLYRRSSAENGVFAQGYYGDVGSTTWWIDYSNFFQGVGTLGGGNLNLVAGRDVANTSAVIPTNAWMPYKTVRADGTVDNLAANQPLFEYGGGDLTVQAGRNIDAGVYYVENGHGVLQAGGNIQTNATRRTIIGSTSASPIEWLPTTLFLGKGGFDVGARGDVLMGPVANPFLLPQGDLNGTWARSYFSTYASDSYVSASSLTGDVTLKGAAETGSEPGTLAQWFTNILAWDNKQGIVSNSHTRPWLRLTEAGRIAGLNESPTGLYGSGTAAQTVGSVYRGQIGLMAPSLEVAAFSGDIGIVNRLVLAPSPSGTVSLFADGAIDGFQAYNYQSYGAKTYYKTGTINLSDVDPDLVPGIRTPMTLRYSDSSLPISSFHVSSSSPTVSAEFFNTLFDETGATKGTSTFLRQSLHDADGLHLNDPEPVYIYAGRGDVSGLTLFSPKVTQLFAGHDITDVAFYIQNLKTDDVSRIVAGRDILPFNETSPARIAHGIIPGGNYSTAPEKIVDPAPGDISIGGPGTLQILAGRNLDLGGAPISTALAQRFSALGLARGIDSIGDARNPYLPRTDGASIIAVAGLGGRNLDVPAFVANFLDPATAGANAARYLPELGKRLGLAGAGDTEVWAAFNALPQTQKEIHALGIFYLVLRDAGRDHNDPAAPGGSKNYEAGFKAIARLFPGDGWSGDISLTAREVKTEAGGDISLFAPGGGLLVGYDLAGSKQPLDQGIMTLRGGNISIFAHDSVTVGTSRIFTFSGGNEIIWSSVGNIAAGSASKTLQAAAPARYLIDPETGASILDLGGLATGGGIGVLQTRADAPPSDVDLIAPSGYVDAGDAGIRSSRNVNIAAVQILNAFNIQAQGATTGVPTVQAPNIGGLTEASNAAGSAARQVGEPTHNTAGQQPSVIIVEILGYGGASEEGRPDDGQRRSQGRQSSNINYESSAMVRVLGNGNFTAEDMTQLTANERNRLTRQSVAPESP
uniref:Filamentous haemagglutinin family outer membrane protein n=1 Tax=Rhodopseudomonas palustris (strain BisA53) TaxID=316055 RepID=Q07HW0_RHOP5